MNIFIRVILTGLLMAWAIEPFVDKDLLNPNQEILEKMEPWVAGLMVLTFFAFVAAYCRQIEKCLEKIKPENRAMTPKSVWYMFFLPFNFVEDFFIVIHLSESIKNEANSNPKLASIKDFGLSLGIGWSIAQILSFIPSNIGLIAGIIGFILVILHWIFIFKITKLLS